MTTAQQARDVVEGRKSPSTFSVWQSLTEHTIREAAGDCKFHAEQDVPEMYRGELSKWLRELGYKVNIPDPHHDGGFGTYFKYKKLFISWND